MGQSPSISGVGVLCGGSPLMVFFFPISTPTAAVAAGQPTLVLSGGKKTNNHKQLLGIVPEMGGGQIVYVFPFFLGKKGNTLTKFPGNLRKRPGQSQDNPGTIPGQFCLCVSLFIGSFPGPTLKIHGTIAFTRQGHRGWGLLKDNSSFQKKYSKAEEGLCTVCVFTTTQLIGQIESLGKDGHWTSPAFPGQTEEDADVIRNFLFNSDVKDMTSIYHMYPLTQNYYLRKIILK